MDEESPVVRNTEEPQMSKRQRKKLMKWQLIAERRKIRKEEKKKERKEEQKRKLKDEDKTDSGNTSARVCSGSFSKKFKSMDCADALPLRIAIDLSFDDLMSDRDILKLLKQIQRTYSINRRSRRPSQLYLTSFGGRSKYQLEQIKCRYQNWDVHIRSEAYSEVFNKNDIVYLTSDSCNVLHELDMSKAYIIGGLVDHNHHKGVCYKVALEQGVTHAQLPIGDFVKLNSRKVLTVNHVFEILLRFAETRDWKDAFYHVLPPRKVVIEDKKGSGEKGDVTGNVAAVGGGNVEDSDRINEDSTRETS